MAARKKMSTKARTAPKAAKAPARAAKAEPVKKARVTAKAAKTRTASAPQAAAASAKATIGLPNKAISQKQSKSQIYAEIAEVAKVSKMEARNILSAIRNIIERHVKPKGSGEVTIPDLGIRVRRVQKKATKARMGRNPFTGEEIQIPAKPARKSVKVSALKTLKALIEE